MLFVFVVVVVVVDVDVVVVVVVSRGRYIPLFFELFVLFGNEEKKKRKKT